MTNLLNKAKLALAFIAIIAFLTPNLFNQVNIPVQAEASKDVYEQTSSVEAKQLDTRAIILRDYLASNNSPMQNNAQDFIEAADTYKVDWKLVPAIAGVESTFGKATPGSDLYPSYNAYGWGVYGNQALYFKSWKDGIYTLNQGLKEKYIDKGLKTPAAMNRVYAASPTWGVRVSHFMEDIDQFAQKYDQKQDNSKLGAILSIRQINTEPETANIPEVIAFK